MKIAPWMLNKIPSFLGPFHIITIATSADAQRLLESRDVALKAEMLQKQFEIAYDV